MLITIDICGDNVYLVEGLATPAAIDVYKCDEAKLPDGTIEDGDIKNHAALAMTLTKLLNARSYKAAAAVITFTSGIVMSRRLTLPPGKPYEISAMVKSQMSQAVSVPSDFVFEYSYAKAVQSKDAPNDVWAYALDKEFIEKYYSVFKSIKLRPVALDIHSNCVEKLLFDASVNGAALSGRSTLFVGIEREFIEIHLFSNSERGFSRIAPVSAAEFLLIADNLGYGRPDSELSLMEKRLSAISDDSVKKKHSDAISYDALDISPEALQKDTILAEAAHQYTGRLADELSKMIQFQMMRDSSLPVACVYLYGSFSGVKGLDTALSQSIECRVEIIENISKVKIDADVKLAKYVNAIGALIRLK